MTFLVPQSATNVTSMVSTVTTQVALTEGSFTEVAVMLAVPLPTAVTRPLSLTVATSVLSEDQVTVSGCTPKGSTLAVSLATLPLKRSGPRC